MAVKIRFDSNQNYQLEAISAVTSLFNGWNGDGTALAEGDDLETNLIYEERIYQNRWGIADENLINNVLAVQSKTRVDELGNEKQLVPVHLRLERLDGSSPRDFSIEMETGTGKTYVYLRTILDLHKQLGLTKFVIVVPNLAIREGVEASFSLLKDHFSEIYPGVDYSYYLYDSKRPNRLKHFANSSSLQILIMNIQAFDKDSTLIRRENERGAKPLDFLSLTNPILILDEPQRLSSKRQAKAIEDLQPFMKLRYSATHKEKHCLVYRLGPVDAFDLNLVKRIEVLSLAEDEDANRAYVQVQGIHANGASAPTATVSVFRSDGKVRKTLKRGDDLVQITGLQIYEGWKVTQIALPNESRGYVEFENGRRVEQSTSTNIDLDWWQRCQIEAAIRSHFETELRLKAAVARGEIKEIKPLTLFFIDKVSNYASEDGKFKVWFDELYREVKSDRRFRALGALPEAKDARKAYFAETRGKAQDSNGDSAEDAIAYHLIMKSKQELIEPSQPVRFIFSHTALSEGWDNPNVFTICNLQEVSSEIKKRQQIGRGLRLPVMVNGERNRNSDFNVLTIVANQSFEEFAAALQTEIETETSETFESRIKPSRERVPLQPEPGYQDLESFKQLWDKISRRTRYSLNFHTEDLVGEATLRFVDLGKLEPISKPGFKAIRNRLSINDSGVGQAGAATSRDYLRPSDFRVGDFLKEMQREVAVSRSAVVEVIENSGRIGEIFSNPAQFVRQLKLAIEQALSHSIVHSDGILYSRIAGEQSKYPVDYFSQKHSEVYKDTLVPVTKSIFPFVVCDSDIERRYVDQLESREDIELFLKLPSWFKIDTPVGGYNPDWAIVQKNQAGTRSFYLVRETKGSTDVSTLRFESEGWKIHFGRKHFDELGIDYDVTTNLDELERVF